MKKGFYKLIPRVSSNSDYTSPDTATPSVPQNEADIADIQEIQKAFLVDCCAEEDPGPERYAWLINKTEFVYRRRYMYAGKNVAAILQTIADRSALFFDYDPTAKNSFLNKRAVPNERVSKTTYDCIRDGVLEDFYQKLKTRRGQQFAQKSKNAARQLIEQIESERKRAKRSLFQWLYSDAHMKVPRQNYSEIKALYTQEDPDGKTPTPAQIRKRIRDDQSIYHIELLSDTVLHQDYSRLLGEAGDAAVLADSNFRSAFLIDVLLPLIQQFKYWQSWKEFPLNECDLRFHDITDFRTRMSDIQRLQERERELALNLKTRPYSLPFDYPDITLPDADCSIRLPSDIIDTMLRFYQEMGTSSINEQDKNILSGNISGVQASVKACSADARLPIILVLLIARYKRQLLNPIARMRAFGEERDYKSPYFGKSIAPSQQRLRYLNLLCTLCIQLEISEENTAHNLNDFVCFFGWQKMSDEELRQWRTLTWQYGYENIPAVGVSLRMYEYGMECLPASYFDLSCRMIRPLQQDVFLELCRKNEAQLQSVYQTVINSIRLFATQYISLWSKEGFYRVEQYNMLKNEQEGTGHFSQICKAIDLSKFELFFDTTEPNKKTHSVQQPDNEWPSPMYSGVLSSQKIHAGKIVKQLYGENDAERQELRLLFAEFLTREYIRNQALKDLFKNADTICGSHTSAFFKLKKSPGWFSYKKEPTDTTSKKDDCVR